MSVDDATSHVPRPNDRPAALWLIRVAALLGLLVSGYLFYLAARGVAPPGCGEGAGCADVLASRWSKVWRLPVSAPAMVVYLVVLAASVHAGPRSPEEHRRKAWAIIALAAVAAGGAAVWFIALQLFELHEVCVFCMAAHTCSLVLAGAALWHGPRLLPQLGLLGVAALITTQLLLPPPVVVNPHVRIAGLDPANAPTLGDPDAPITLALLYDYNCHYCLQTHTQLQHALERYPGQIAIVLLPTAMDPACNRHVEKQVPISRSSCALARLALAVWIADPARLAEFDAYLVKSIPRWKIDGSVPIEAVAGEFTDEAAKLVGRESLAEALTDPRIDDRLARSANVYAVAVDPVLYRRGVPRVIIGELPYAAFQDEQQLFRLLEDTYPELKDPAENR